MPGVPALAADLPEAYFDAPVVYEVASNWYLRGDLGYKWYSAPDASFDYAGYGNFEKESLADTGVVGLGFGYRFSPYFRTDFTVDYEWDSQFKGKLKCPDPCQNIYSTEYATIDAWSGLANFYWDIDLSGEGLAGFIPYIGAGIGFSNLTTSKVKYTNPDGSTGTWKGDSQTNLAWALMAGVSVPMSNNWIFDINYRYLDLGDAQSGKTLKQFDNARIKYKDITASEVRVGLRYMLQ